MSRIWIQQDASGEEGKQGSFHTLGRCQLTQISSLSSFHLAKHQTEDDIIALCT